MVYEDKKSLAWENGTVDQDTKNEYIDKYAERMDYTKSGDNWKDAEGTTISKKDMEA